MLLIREHKRARCQAEIPLTALSETVEPSLSGWPDVLRRAEEYGEPLTILIRP
jgi:hypothetical protein